MITALLLFACKPEEDTVEVSDPPEQLEAPPLDGLDLEALYQDALAIALTADLRGPWAAHRDLLRAGVRSGCPDVYLGTPDLELDELDEDVRGTAWMDICDDGTDRWSGWAWWDGYVRAEGDAATAEGRTVEGEREIVGDAIIAQGDTVLLEFDGEGSDAFQRTDAPDYLRWSYTSLVDGTVTGTLPFEGTPTPFGYRTDMYLSYAGGAGATVELRGNVYLFEGRIQDRLDSVSANLEFVSPDGAAPDVCTLEPRGWLSVRDPDAIWYDLVFEPRYEDDATGEDYPNDPLTVCDGCGTLYVRGLPQLDEQGEEIKVCPDFSFLWAGGLQPPDTTGYSFTLRELLEDG